MYKLMTSPFVPVPLTEAAHSYIGDVVIATVFDDFVPTTTEFEAALNERHVLDAFAVIVLPKPMLIPVEAVQVPFANTVVVDPSATPFSYTCIVVPAGSTDVPETEVIAAVVQIGPLTVGANATLFIVAVTEPVDGQRLVAVLIATRDSVSHSRLVSDKLPIVHAPAVPVVVVPICTPLAYK